MKRALRFRLPDGSGEMPGLKDCAMPDRDHQVGMMPIWVMKLAASQ